MIQFDFLARYVLFGSLSASSPLLGNPRSRIPSSMTRHSSGQRWRYENGRIGLFTYDFLELTMIQLIESFNVVPEILYVPSSIWQTSDRKTFKVSANFPSEVSFSIYYKYMGSDDESDKTPLKVWTELPSGYSLSKKRKEYVRQAMELLHGSD